MGWKKRRTQGQKSGVEQSRSRVIYLRIGLLTIACSTVFVFAWYGLRAGRRLCGESTIPTAFTVAMHHMYDPVVREQLETLVASWGDASYPLSRVVPALEELKSQDLLVDRVAMRVDAQRRCCIDIYGVQPIGLINKKYVLGVNGVLYDAKRYVDVALPCAPLQVAQANMNGQELVEVVRQLDDPEWAAWHITYHSAALIALTPTDTTKRYVVVTDKESLRDKKRYNQIPALEREVAQRAHMLRRRERWVFDLRFAHHIVVRKEQKGDAL